MYGYVGLCRVMYGYVRLYTAMWGYVGGTRAGSVNDNTREGLGFRHEFYLITWVRYYEQNSKIKIRIKLKTRYISHFLPQLTVEPSTWFERGVKEAIYIRARVRPSTEMGYNLPSVWEKRRTWRGTRDPGPLNNDVILARHALDTTRAGAEVNKTSDKVESSSILSGF